MNPTKLKYCETYMQEVWESWDWHFNDKLAQLDYMTRQIIKEFGMQCVPESMWKPFMQQKLMDGLAECAARQEMEKGGKAIGNLV